MPYAKRCCRLCAKGKVKVDIKRDDKILRLGNTVVSYLNRDKTVGNSSDLEIDLKYLVIFSVASFPYLLRRNCEVALLIPQIKYLVIPHCYFSSNCYFVLWCTSKFYKHTSSYYYLFCG